MNIRRAERNDRVQVLAVPGNAKHARALLDRLRADGREFSAKLRQLETHPAYRRLRTAHSTGSTQRAWDRAATQADELTAQLRTYHAALDRADVSLSARRRATRPELAEMTALLNGPLDAIEVPTGIPVDRHDEAAVGPGVVALMTTMNATYDEVSRTVDDIEECASIVRQRLHTIAEMLRGLRAGTTSLTFRDDMTIDVLDGLERELIDITPAAHADPKGCVMATGDGSGAGTPDRLRRLTVGVENAQAHLSALTRQQAELQTALADLRTELAQVEGLEEERWHAESLVRTRITGVPDDDQDVVAPLRTALAQFEQRRTSEVWAETKEAIDALSNGLALAREQATSRRDTARALLGQRDELRGRLSAYRAMATRLKHAEDLDLTEEYERTYHILWSGPCDLAAAAEAVATYQRAVIERTQIDDTVHSRGPNP
jgi:hypothetical protein